MFIVDRAVVAAVVGSVVCDSSSGVVFMVDGDVVAAVVGSVVCDSS